MVESLETWLCLLFTESYFCSWLKGANLSKMYAKMSPYISNEDLVVHTHSIKDLVVLDCSFK